VVVDLPTAKKPTHFVGSSKDDLRGFPEEVRDGIGYAIFKAETGGKHSDAKPLRGFGGAGVLEVVARYDRGTYRAVYTVKFSGAIYVLHAFQKKSKKGTATPRADKDLIEARLKEAQEHYETHYQKRTG
jgi:phage-related protein